MIAALGAPSRCNAATKSGARSGGTAISRPPDVCASASSIRTASPIPLANVTPSATLARLRSVPPAMAPRSAISRARGIRGTAAAVISAATPLASSKLRRCPRRPNPVTSVAAWTPTATIARAAPALRVVITVTAGSRSASERRSRFSAVVSTPVPMGFVSTSRSPGRAAAFVTIRSGWASPIATIPYFGSGSSTEWPPTMKAPASRAASAPPRSTSPSSSNGSLPRGQPTMLRAKRGVAAIA